MGQVHYERPWEPTLLKPDAQNLLTETYILSLLSSGGKGGVTEHDKRDGRTETHSGGPRTDYPVEDTGLFQTPSDKDPSRNWGQRRGPSQFREDTNVPITNVDTRVNEGRSDTRRTPVFVTTQVEVTGHESTCVLILHVLCGHRTFLFTKSRDSRPWCRRLRNLEKEQVETGTSRIMFDSWTIYEYLIY